ncbi:TPA: lipopolysaccharide biosynthesis protein [Photobacterium damselae]
MSLLKGASVYLFSNILNAVIPFLLLPILTRYLSPSEYGQIAMFQTLLSGIGTFIGLNAVGSANRKFYDSDINAQVLKQFNGSCVQILIISSFISFIAIIFFKNQLSEFLSIPISWILVSILISALTFIILMRLGQWQIRNQAKWFGVLQVSNSLINMLISLVFIIILNKGAQGRIDAQIFTSVFISIIALYWLYKDKLLQVFIWKPEYIKEALSFGVPLIPHHVGFFLISAVDRFIINQKLGLTEAGMYMVAVQLSSSIIIFFDALNKAYVPWLFEKLKYNDIKDKLIIVKYTYIYFVILLIVAIVIFIIGPFFVKFIAGDSYQKAGEIIGFLCLGQIFGGMYLMVTNFIFYTKKTGQLGLITITTGILNCLLLIYFINWFGLLGASIAYSITKFVQFIFTWYLAARVVKMPWNLRGINV